MFNDKYLIPEWRTAPKEGMRGGIGRGLVKLGKQAQDMVVLTADLAESTRVREFAEEYPERFFDVGVAEQNLIGVAAGLSNEGFVPFTSSFATFSPGRSWEQIRVSVCMPRANVKILGSHAGVATGFNGPTHQATEDIAIMRALPNMTVITPVDANQAEEAIQAAYNHAGPVYIRSTRPEIPVFTKMTSFTIGKSYVYKEGRDITICACGIQVYFALIIADQLESEGVNCEVINVATIKPLDKETLLRSAKKTGKVITLEDHQISGGMGSAIAEMFSENYPLLVKRLGIPDKFGMSGAWEDVYKEMGLDHARLKKAVVDWFHE